MSCAFCGEKALLQCSKCKMVRYCCREHQVLDFDDHKEGCKRLLKAIEKMKREEKMLRDSNTNPFADMVGNFGPIFETKDYMRARFDVVGILDSMGSTASLTAAVDHVFDLLKLSRSDNLGARNRQPAMLLRLGRDQECYDFIKWWLNCTPLSGHHYNDVSLPYLDLKNADIFEPVDSHFMDTSVQYTAAMTLIKYRILYTLKNIKHVLDIFDHTFLLGTHARLGEASPIKRLAGNHHVLSHIRGYLPEFSNVVTSMELIKKKWWIQCNDSTDVDAS